MDRDDPWAGRFPAASLLGGLDSRTRVAMLRLGRVVRVADGDQLLCEGDPGTHVFLLLYGWFKVSTATDGQEVLIAIRSAGDLVGEIAVFDRALRSAAVRAAGPGSAHRIERDDFLEFLASHQAASQAVLRAMADKIRWATRRRGEFASCPVDVRVARVLVAILRAQCQPIGGEVAIGGRLTQPELASLAGASVPSVQRVLRTLRTIGVVETSYRQIMVRDPGKLACFAGDVEWETDAESAFPFAQ